MYHWDRFTHPNLYQIDGTHVAFIRLTANVEHTWQTNRDVLVDIVRLLQDRNPQTAITVPHAPYEGLSTHCAERTIMTVYSAESNCTCSGRFLTVVLIGWSKAGQMLPNGAFGVGPWMQHAIQRL